jgi:UDP-glucose 4-epimerase
MRPRRPGDVAICLSDPGQAKKELGWQATRGLEDMLRDAWRWHTQNPQGYVAQPAGSEI